MNLSETFEGPKFTRRSFLKLMGKGAAAISGLDKLDPVSQGVVSQLDNLLSRNKPIRVSVYPSEGANRSGKLQLSDFIGSVEKHYGLLRQLVGNRPIVCDADVFNFSSIVSQADLPRLVRLLGEYGLGLEPASNEPGVWYTRSIMGRSDLVVDFQDLTTRASHRADGSVVTPEEVAQIVKTEVDFFSDRDNIVVDPVKSWWERAGQYNTQMELDPQGLERLKRSSGETTNDLMLRKLRTYNKPRNLCAICDKPIDPLSGYGCPNHLTYNRDFLRKDKNTKGKFPGKIWSKGKFQKDPSTIWKIGGDFEIDESLSSPQRRIILRESDDKLRRLRREVESGNSGVRHNYFIELIRAGRVSVTDLQVLCVFGVPGVRSVLRVLGEVPLDVGMGLDFLWFVLHMDISRTPPLMKMVFAEWLVDGGVPRELIDWVRKWTGNFTRTRSPGDEPLSFIMPDELCSKWFVTHRSFRTEDGYNFRDVNSLNILTYGPEHFWDGGFDRLVTYFRDVELRRLFWPVAVAILPDELTGVVNPDEFVVR